MTYPLAAPSSTISPATRERLARLLAEYPNKPAALLTALYLVQAECNHLSDSVLDEFATIMEMPKSVIYEVTTFYSLYSTKPVGRNIIMVCQNLCCFLRGSDEVVMAIARELGIKPGETTADGKFTLRPVECLAACERAPAIQINDKLMGPISPADIPAILAEYRR
ncbi:MAG: NADH-quinone oxidoreductase subunit NuoE [Candidatus Methylomirabilia bacterium]